MRNRKAKMKEINFNEQKQIQMQDLAHWVFCFSLKLRLQNQSKINFLFSREGMCPL